MITIKSFTYSVVNPVFYRSALIYFNGTSLKSFLIAMVTKHVLEKTDLYKQQRINNVHLVPSALGKVNMPEIDFKLFPGVIDVYHIGSPGIDMMPRLLEMAENPAVGSMVALCHNTAERMKLVLALGASPTKVPVRLVAPVSDSDLMQATTDFIMGSMMPSLLLDARHQRAHDLYKEVEHLAKTDDLLFSQIDYAFEAMFRESMLVRTDEGPMTALRSFLDCCQKLFDLLDLEAADMLHIARERQEQVRDSLDKEVNEATVDDLIVCCEDITNRRRDLAQVLGERFPGSSLALLWRREIASNKSVSFAYRILPMPGGRINLDEYVRIQLAAMIDGHRDSRGDHYSPEPPLVVHRKLARRLTQMTSGE